MRSPTKLLAAAGVSVALATGSVAAFDTPDAAPRLAPASGVAAAAASTTVRVTLAHGGRIASRFLGLSFEARELPAIARLAAVGNLASLLRSLGPGTLRFGGNSVDATTAWSDDGRTKPRWARVVVSPANLDGLARLARETGWNVLLAVTLGHPDAAAAGREVAAARARLGPALAGVEIGNEPDQYIEKHLRRRPWGYARYRRQVAAYRAAITSAAPGVPLAGPDLASAKPSSWLSSYARAVRPALLTAHFYPLERCRGKHPTIAELMSPDLHASESRVLGRLVALAHRDRLSLRLGETNNIACSGLPGVSDRYAASLWALDYLVRLIDAGVRGVNLHGFVGECRTYTPLCAAARGARLSQRPEWFALRLASMLTPGRRIRAAIAPGRRDLIAQAVEARDGSLRVLVVDEGATAARLTLELPRGFRAASALRLTAPGLAATSGVRLTSARLPHAARIGLALPRYSAVLVRAAR